jgi:hypothetical protein
MEDRVVSGSREATKSRKEVKTVARYHLGSFLLSQDVRGHKGLGEPSSQDNIVEILGIQGKYLLHLPRSEWL